MYVMIPYASQLLFLSFNASSMRRETGSFLSLGLSVYFRLVGSNGMASPESAKFECSTRVHFRIGLTTLRQLTLVLFMLVSNRLAHCSTKQNLLTTRAWT
jgi:hypothetical protein